MDKDTVNKVARLAQINVNENEVDAVASKLEGIMSFVEQLSEVDTANVKPLESVHELANDLRADVVNDGGISEKVLKNAPESQEGFFVVSKIVE